MQTILIAFIGLNATAKNIPAAFATFDGLSEGFYGSHLTDGDITFFGVDEHLPFPGGDFVIDDIRNVADLFPEWGSFYSPPNILTMTALVAGPQGGGSRFGELMMTTGRVETFASVEVYHFDTVREAGNFIALDAYLDGELVDSDVVTLSEINGDAKMDLLSIENVSFDVLRIAAVGSETSGERPYFVGGIDNILIIPEPLTLTFLAIGALMMRRRHMSAP